MKPQLSKMFVLFLLAFILAPGRASAEEAGVVAGGKVGGGFGQPFGPFGSSIVPELEVGYVLPVLDGGIVPFLSATYAAPRTEAEAAADERLPGDGVMSYDIVQEQLVLTLGARYFLPLELEPLSPYVSAGPRLYLMRTRIRAESGGQYFGYNEETQSRLGLHLAAGAEASLGPGAALVELGMGWAKIDGHALRDTSAGALTISAGYRLMF